MELGWDEARVEQEKKDAEEFLATFGGPIPKKEQAKLRAATRRDLLDTFRSVDVDQSGALDRSEVSLMAKRLGFELMEEELDIAMTEMDLDHDGNVSFDEFVTWWNDESESEIAKKLKDNIGLSTKTSQTNSDSGLPLG